MCIRVDSNLICRAVHEYSDTILRIAFHHTRSNADAEDIVQETFLSLMKCKQVLADERHLKAWLIRVAINKCKDLHKSARKKRTVALEIAVSTKYYLDYNDTEVLDQIQQLPPEERNIVYLFYFEGYSAKEIGVIIGKKEDAIFTRLKRIREKLRNLL